MSCLMTDGEHIVDKDTVAAGRVSHEHVVCPFFAGQRSKFLAETLRTHELAVLNDGRA